MLEFIKMFGLGVLYTLLSPVFVLVLALASVFALICYLVNEAIYLGGFFAGKKYDGKTKLEKQLAVVKEQKEKEEEAKAQLNAAIQTKLQETLQASVMPPINEEEEVKDGESNE